MNNNCGYFRYIPPVDLPFVFNAPAQNLPISIKRPPESSVPNTLGTNPLCPISMCNKCSGNNCKCNLNHMKAPHLHRYWVYKYNLY